MIDLILYKQINKNQNVYLNVNLLKNLLIYYYRKRFCRSIIRLKNNLKFNYNFISVIEGKMKNIHNNLKSLNIIKLLNKNNFTVHYIGKNKNKILIYKDNGEKYLAHLGKNCEKPIKHFAKRYYDIYL